ncbi:hypothetical protein VT84_07310 [Gemmata sp. SH-PL17]|uniref:hypothetical protein n=1 Tax=Gemmata sp. SH-PL17 TaxID=1630693 RepID=UPI00078CF632|nr:hypothetical protein [Gemmata sp. SH-PL17]AMV24188.1 hypothetical protein VT84_07310 [Gemmata sp. SH-PL17]
MNGLSLVCDGGDPHLGGFYPKHGNPHERYIEFLVAPALAPREAPGGPDPGAGGV